jgi:hypothetical protein
MKKLVLCLLCVFFLCGATVNAQLPPSQPPLPRMVTPVDDDGWRPAGCGPECTDCQPATRGGAQKQPILPYRKAEAAMEQKLEQQIAELRGQIASIQAAIANAPKGSQPDPQVLNGLSDLNNRLATLESKKPDAVQDKSPGNKLEQKLDDFLHKLPIQGPLTKLEEKQLESEHPLQRFFGANTAIVLLTLVGVGLLLGVVLVLHAIYKAAHAHIAAITAKEAAIPVVGKYLAAGTAALDTFNTNQVDPKLTGLLDSLHAKLTALEAKVAPPTATQPTAAPAITVNVPAAK